MSAVQRLLWLGVAVTMPLFGVSFLRLDLDSVGIHIAVPMAGLICVIALGCVMALMNDPGLERPLVFPEDRSLLAVLYLFLLYHVFSSMFSLDASAGRKEVLKVATSSVAFWGALAFFPRDRRFLGRFLKVTLWSSMVLAGFLIYMYAFVFRTIYLGTNLEAEDKFGRAQLAWYLAVLFPYAFFYFWKARNRLASFLPAMVLTVALLYDQTRGAWIAVACGLAYIVIFLWRISRSEAVKMGAAIFGGGTLMVGAALWLMSMYVNITELVTRFISIYDPGDVPELHSYEVRLGTVSDAWAGFTTSPLIGVGLTNGQEFTEHLTHNDAAAVLVDLGAVGIVLFTALLVMLMTRAGVWRPEGVATMDWLALGSRAGYVVMIVMTIFLNTYTTIAFWFFAALFMLSRRMETLP
jgi:hypothetical protein